MSKIRTHFERFCYRHRNKGIPNLMLYITLANAVVYAISLFTNSAILYDALRFDRDLILQGQVWRLLTCAFTGVFNYGNVLFVAIGLFCYFTLGRAIENTWGTFRFNLFYLTGLLLMEIFAMTFGYIPVTIDGYTLQIGAGFYSNISYYLNLSLFIAYATLYPDTRFLLFYIIPVKAWIFALVDLGITLFDVYNYTVVLRLFPHGLFPLVALLNYFLFFGKDVLNVIPVSWRVNTARLFRKKQKKTTEYKTVPFPTAGSYQATVSKPKAPHNHQCTICGRTDLSDPDLEFRYCSRCNGYYCYCEDHILNHTHVE